MATTRKRPAAVSEATKDDYDALLKLCGLTSKVTEVIRSYETTHRVNVSYDKLCRLVRAKKTFPDGARPARGRRQVLSEEACAFITSLIRGYHSTKGRVPYSLLKKLMRGLLAAELGLLSADALEPLQV